MIGDYFKAIGKLMFFEHRGSEILTVKLESQLHEMHIPLTWTPSSPYSPQQQREMEVISMLRGRASDAYMLVLCEGLSALSGRPVTPADIGTIVDTTIEHQAKQLDDCRRNAIALQLVIDEKEARIDALERAIARRASDDMQADMRRAVEEDDAA